MIVLIVLESGEVWSSVAQDECTKCIPGWSVLTDSGLIHSNDVMIIACCMYELKSTDCAIKVETIDLRGHL